MFDKELRLLGIEKISSKEELKKVYYDKIKLYPPELYENEFINITSAYETLSNYLNNLNIIEELEKKEKDLLEEVNFLLVVIRKSIVINNIQSLDKSILSLCNIINLKNFNLINEKCIDFIIELCNENYLEEAILLAIHLDKSFKKLELIDLSKAYKNLEKFIISKYS